MNTALKAITADGKVSRSEAAAVADVMARDPVTTRPAAKAAQEFLALVGTDHSLDAATRNAVMAEFALVGAPPFRHLDVPGPLVKNTVDLPANVQKPIADVNEAGGVWEEVETRKATLAGQPVFIVNYNSLDGDGDPEKVRIFSATNGKQIAQGAIWDGMSGFGWD